MTSIGKAISLGEMLGGWGGGAKRVQVRGENLLEWLIGVLLRIAVV